MKASPTLPCIFVVAALLAARTLPAGAAETMAAAVSLPADEAALLAELDALEREMHAELTASNWDITLEAELGAGYRSNPTLSALDEQESAVLRGTVDVFAWRLPVDGFEWVNLFDATTTHFFSGDTNDAVIAVARSEARWDVGRSSLLSVAGQLVYHDEVIDASTLDSGLTSARAEVQTPSLETKWKWQPAEAWKFTALVRAEHDDFRPPLDDFNAYRSTLTLERSLGRLGSLAATAGYMKRDYATRQQAADGGRLLPDTSLRVGRPEYELRHDLRGGEKIEWHASTRAGFKENNDNGSGWYDYQQVTAGFSLTLDGKAWSLESELEFVGYLYRLQRSGFGDPPRRTHDNWTWFVRFERVLAPAWTAFVELNLENSRSNDPFLVYTDNLALLGVRWSR